MDTESLLAKEVLVIIFRAFPGQFVLVGGGALHWIYHSPRRSVDLDLKPLHTAPKNILIKMAEVLNKKLSPVGARLGSSLVCEALAKEQSIRIRVDGRPALLVELAPLAPGGGKEKHLLQSDSLESEIIVTPSLNELLFAKAAAFVKRGHLKGRDVFDLWFLKERGATIDAHAFEDYLKWEEKDASDIEKRLKEVTPARLDADLSRYLPDSIRKPLQDEKYKTLIQAAQTFFQPFLDSGA